MQQYNFEQLLQQIERAQAEMGLSDAALSKAMKRDNMYVRGMKKNKIAIGSDAIFDLCLALNRTPNYFFGLDEPQSPEQQAKIGETLVLLLQAVHNRTGKLTGINIPALAEAFIILLDTTTQEKRPITLTDAELVLRTLKAANA